MKATYRVLQLRSPGVLEAGERAVPDIGRGEVLIAVEACGVCGADLGDIAAERQEGAAPRVPGHTVIGRIVATGSEVPEIWVRGQRAGVVCNNRCSNRRCIATSLRRFLRGHGEWRGNGVADGKPSPIPFR